MRRLTLCFLIAALAVGLAASTAGAAKGKRLRSQIEIEWFDNSGGSSLFGDVHSKKNKCERNREVTLYHDVDGTLEEVGTDTTDRTGDWVIPAELDLSAPFVASVEKRKLGRGDRKLVCKPAESPPFVIEP